MIEHEKLPAVRGTYRFNETLSKHTWLGVGGPAEVMFVPADAADLQFFLQHKLPEWPVFVLGGGANLLVRDGGIAGVVIKLEAPAFAAWRVEGEKLYCGGGLKNFALKKILPEHELGGLEFLCSIPGTIGGALRSNAGCFGGEIGSVLHSAKVMNGKGEIFAVGPEDFHLSYRHSDFSADWIIVEVVLTANKTPGAEIAAKIAANDEYRRTHQPQGIRTAGSTFKNPAGYRAWELIKNAGGNEMVVGGAQMSAQHCNFLQANANATAADIETLGEKIIAAVKAQSGVTLEWEVERVGQK